MGGGFVFAGAGAVASLGHKGPSCGVAIAGAVVTVVLDATFLVSVEIRALAGLGKAGYYGLRALSMSGKILSRSIAGNAPMQAVYMAGNLQDAGRTIVRGYVLSWTGIDANAAVSGTMQAAEGHFDVGGFLQDLIPGWASKRAIGRALDACGA